MKMPKRQSSKLRRISWILVVLLIVSGGVYGYFSTNTSSPNHQAADRYQAPAPAPKDDKPVFPTLSEVPVRIVIDKIGVDATIEPVGLTPDGMMDAPATNELVGWYDKSARAGDDEYSMLLDGHYGSDTVPAVFRDLVDLQVGDSIKVYGQQGAELEYQVVETDQQYAEDVDMKKALYPYRDGVQSLTIITCQGLYDPINVTYDKRTVVYAERVS